MRLPGGDVIVDTGTAVRNGKFMPLVELQVNGQSIHIPPAAARKIGADLIDASAAAVADTLLRQLAHEHGLDGDGLITRLKTVLHEAGL